MLIKVINEDSSAQKMECVGVVQDQQGIHTVDMRRRMGEPSSLSYPSK